MEQTSIKAPATEQFPSTHIDRQRYGEEVEKATKAAARFATAVEEISSEGIDPTEENLRAVASDIDKYFSDLLKFEAQRRGYRLRTERQFLSDAFDIAKREVAGHVDALQSVFNNPAFAFKQIPEFGIDIEATQRNIEQKHTYELDTEAMEGAWKKVQAAKAAVKGLNEIYSLFKVSLLTTTKMEFVPHLGSVPAKVDASEDIYGDLNLTREDFFEKYCTCFFKEYLSKTEEIRQRLAQWKSEDIESKEAQREYLKEEAEAYQKMIAEEQAKKDIEREVSEARQKRLLNNSQQTQ